MSKLQVDDIVNKEIMVLLASKGAVTGVATATHFSGNLTGTVVTATTFVGALVNLHGLTGTQMLVLEQIPLASPLLYSSVVYNGTAGTFSGDVSVRNITGVAATFSGKLSYKMS